MKIFAHLFEPAKEESFINDRRQAKRYEAMLKVSYYDTLTKNSGESLSKDISKYGVRFPVTTRLEKGSILDLRIEDPNSNKTFSSKARVMWLEEFVYGDDADSTRYEIGVRLLNKRLF